MQTFLPYSDFEKSAQVLDFRRLGKQRSEALTIIRAIEDGNDWSTHPVTKMWTGHTRPLKLYHDIIIREWVDRGDERLHRSHKSNLLRKDPEYYGQYDWNVSPDLDYFWPTKEDYDVNPSDEKN